MTRSVLSNLNFDEKNWVITIFNGGTLLSPHAVMLVEGIKPAPTTSYVPGVFAGAPPEAKLLYCVYQFDITAIANHDEEAIARLLQEDKISATRQLISRVKAACTNTHGFISNIREYKAEAETKEAAYTRPGGYEQFRLGAKSFRRSAQATQVMINHIRSESLRVRSIWDNVPDQAPTLLPPYQYRGKTHFFGDPSGGLNCSECAYSWLNIADSRDNLKLTEAQAKPKPPCVVL